MRAVWSPLAIQRVREIVEYIGLDRPAAAERWAEGAVEAVRRLTDFPRSGRIVPELGREDVREVIYGRYRVVYRVSEDEVLILTIRHGSRLLDSDELDAS